MLSVRSARLWGYTVRFVLPSVSLRTLTRYCDDRPQPARRGVLLTSWFLLCCICVPAQLVPNNAVSGIVTDPTGAAIIRARVIASKVSGNVSRAVTTDAAGRFSFPEMTPGRYVLHVEAPGFKDSNAIAEIGLRNSVPITIVLAVQSTQETVTVEGTGTDVETAARAHADISSSLTNALPDTAVNGGFSRVLTLGTPGVAAESNGGFHPLGEHAEVSFSVDGQPISDQQSRTFSNQVSLNTVESIDVINGAPPAEFGDKTSMIVRAVTRSGLGAGPPTGTVSLGYGTFGTGTTDLSLRMGDSKVGNFFAADAVNSQRFLDPPEFVPLHATGNGENIFDRFDLQPTAGGLTSFQPVPIAILVSDPEHLRSADRAARTSVSSCAAAISPSPIPTSSAPRGCSMPISGGAEISSTTIHPGICSRTSPPRSHRNGH